MSLASAPRLASQLAVAALLALAVPAAAAAPSPTTWFPLETDTRRVYTLHRDRVVEPEGTTANRQFFHGRATFRTVSRDEDGRIRARRTETEREALLAGASSSTSRREIDVYSVDGAALRLHAQQGVAGPGEIERYDPPLVVLRTPLAPGRRWKVGTLRNGALELEVEAEVLGRESITVEGRAYPDTVRVRFRGPVSGALEGPDSEPLAVEGGRYRREMWLARGLGPVREVTELDLELRDEEDRRLRLSDVSTYELRPAAHRGEDGSATRDGEPAP